MIIYCNGDSFVAGVELADDLIPDHPGYSSFNIVDKAAAKWKENSNNINHPLGQYRETIRNEIFKTEYERAFPNTLSSLIDATVVNKALGGTSLDRVVRTTIIDLITYKENNEKVVAIVGIPPLDRSEIANCDSTGYKNPLGEPDHWHSLALGYKSHWSVEVDAIRDYKIMHETTYHRAIGLYKNIILLQDFCKVNDIPLFWLLPLKSSLIDPVGPPSDYLTLKKYANLSISIDMQDIAIELGDGTCCPHRHFSKKVHDEVARRIVNILQENNYV